MLVPFSSPPPPTRLEIAIADSGCGLLTVAHPLTRIAPALGLRLICDNRGHPYGAKTDEEVAESLVAAVRPHAPFVDAVVVGCHSGSRPPVLTRVAEAFGLPVFGMMDSWMSLTTKACLRLGAPARVVLMGTELTIRKGMHEHLLREEVKALGGRLESIKPVACPRLATLVDRAGGRPSAEVQEEIRGCLRPHLGKMDVLGLICSHYGVRPVYRLIANVAGPSVLVAEAGFAVARRVAAWAGPSAVGWRESLLGRALLFTTCPDPVGTRGLLDLWSQLTDRPLEADGAGQQAA